MVVKEYGVDFTSEGGALTLNSYEVHKLDEDDENEDGVHTRTHPDGWTISGEIHEDYYEWVKDFEATHPLYGRVWGDFEDKVFADSEEGFAHFWHHHQPKAWDYDDI